MFDEDLKSEWATIRGLNVLKPLYKEGFDSAEINEWFKNYSEKLNAYYRGDSVPPELRTDERLKRFGEVGDDFDPVTMITDDEMTDSPYEVSEVIDQGIISSGGSPLLPAYVKVTEKS